MYLKVNNNQRDYFCSNDDSQCCWITFLEINPIFEP